MRARIRRDAVCFTLTAVLALNAAGAVTRYWTGAVSTNWNAAANWSENVVPVAGDDVVVSNVGLRPYLSEATPHLNSLLLANGQTLTQLGWDSAVTATDMQINGTVKHGINPGVTNSLGQWVPLHRIYLVGTNITINGTLDANGAGFRRYAGPGRANDDYSGGGYGTVGGWGWSQGYYSGGPEYGDPAMPEMPGSGGGSVNTSREGGGAIRVAAIEHLAINGILTANGVNGATSHGGGGSGGGIWLSCRTFGGIASGVVRASGGNGNSCGGGGGGGRIAVHYDATAQAEMPLSPVQFEASAGLQGADTRIPPKQQAMGTLFLTDAGWLQSNLSGKRFYQTKLVIPGMSKWSHVGDLMLNACRIELERGVSLEVTGSLVLTNGAALVLQAAPVADPLATAGVKLQIGSNLALHSGCWIYPVADHTNGAMATLAVGGNLFVAAGSGFDADATGYAPGEGPGRAQAVEGDGHGGGGYGGQGGSGYNGGGQGASYGKVEGPVQCGSGGGEDIGFRCGSGGGAIRLEIEGNAVINGWLTARGGISHYGHRGGGAGGGISLTCRTLRGGSTGLIRVDGGTASMYAGNGGGGRIVIDYDRVHQAAEVLQRPELKFSGYVTPISRSGSVYILPPEMGTLWLPDFQLLSDGPAAACTLSDSRFWYTRVFIANHEETWSPAALTLDNCYLGLPDGFTLNVAGPLLLTNGAAIRVRASATNGSDRLFGATLSAGTELVVHSNSWIYPLAAPTNGAVVGILVGGTARVAAGGGIDASGGGFYPSPNNKIGPGAGGNYNCGGGYGGHGAGTLGGAIYGNAVLPVLPGSPAGWYTTTGKFNTAGRGGGVILLLANGTIHLDGKLLADGQQGCSYKGASGSGGSIFLAAQRFTGNGQLLARGQPWGTTFSTFSSGGGRIAVWRGIDRAQVDACLAGAALPSLAVAASIPSFQGTVDVASIGTEDLVYAGSAGFYYQPMTVLIVR